MYLITNISYNTLSSLINLHCKSKINNIDRILLILSPDHKVVRFDITVDKAFHMKELDS